MQDSRRYQTRHTPRQRSARFTGIELLEARIAPATHVWIGPSSGGQWSNAANWNGGIPTTGEANGTIVQFNGNISSTDNIAGLVIGEIHFTAGGNTISGGAGITLGINGQSTLHNLVNDAGDNTIASSLPLITSVGTLFAMVPAGKVHLRSNISGTQGFTMEDGSTNGVVSFEADNSYAGNTTIRDGTLELNSGGSSAVPGPLLIGNNTGAAASAVVRLIQSTEIDDSSVVSVSTDGWFDLNGHTDIIASLSLTSGSTSGALVSTGPGTNSLSLASGGSIQLLLQGGGGTPAVISGTLNLVSGNHTITVNDGTAASDLIISAQLIAGFTKAGPGALELAPPVANTLDSITVADGTLILNSPGPNAAITSSLIIGDGVGNTSTAVVQLNIDNQIADNVAVTVHTDGRLFLNNFNETIGSLSLDSGTTGAGAVSTGTSTLGLAGDITTVTTGTGATAPTILGHLDFGDAVHSIITADGAATTDLLLGATVSASIAYIKAGPGTLETEAAGPAGVIEVNSGTLLLSSSGNSDAAPGGIFIGTDTGVTATVRLTHDSEIGANAMVYIKSDGVLDLNNFSDSVGDLTLLQNTTVGSKIMTGTGTLAVMGTTVEFAQGAGGTAPTISGNIDFHGHTIEVQDGAGSSDLIISANITGNSGYVIGGVIHGGTMEVRGSGPTGPVTVANSTLLLNSNGSNDAIQGPLFIGGSSGSVGIVRLAQPTEISDTTTVQVNNTGVFDLTGFGESIAALILQEGDSLREAQVITGAAALSVLGDISTTVAGTGPGKANINGTLDLPAGDHEFHIADGPASSDLEITATITGTGALIKTGAGTLELNNNLGDNTYTGATAIHEGVLLLTSQSAINTTSLQITVGDGIGGPGTAVLRLGAGDVIPDAATITIASDGLFDFSGHSDNAGAVSLLAHGTMNVGTGTAGTGDFSLPLNSTLALQTGKVNVTGTVTLGGSLAQSVFTGVTLGVARTIIDNDGTDAVVGTFAGLPEGAVFGTNVGLFQISYAGGDGNDVTITSVDAGGVMHFAANGKSATYTDIDGDLVTVKTTKGTLTKDNFQLGNIGSGLVNGYQLQVLLLNQTQYDGAAITVTAKPTALGGNGHVNIDTIFATGHDLASITVPGDVSLLEAGDSDAKKPGVGKFVADSMGVFGSRIGLSGGTVKNVGTFTVKGDVRGADLDLGTVGTITIGGSFIGTLFDAGNIEITSAKKIAIGGSLVAIDGFDNGAIFASGDLLALSIGLDVVGSAHILANGKLGAVTIKGGVKGSSPGNSAIISGAGSAVAPKAGLDTAIASLTIGHSAENLVVRAGYDSAGNPVSADAAIGKISIGGDFRASSILVGAAPGADGLFGTTDDTKASVARDDAKRVSTIASLIIKGQALGTLNDISSLDLYSIVAEQITTAKIGGSALKLKAGARSLSDTFALGFLGSGPGNLPSDFYLHEISA